MSQSFKELFIHQISKKRSLRANILALFISLFGFAFICILSFTYSKNYQSILSLSKTVADETIALIRNKFEIIALNAERDTHVASDFLSHIGDLNFKNTILQSYLLTVTKNTPNISNFFVGFPNGDVLAVFRITPSYNDFFVKEPTKHLPKEVHFVLRFIEKSASPSIDIWKYLSEDFEEIATETVSPVTFDLKTRPWYTGALDTQKLFWTKIYTFVPAFEKGITVSNPLFIDGQLTAVIGVDLSFNLLSDFLLGQNVGKSGRVVILGQKGEILVPNLSPSDPITADLIHAAYTRFEADQSSPDFIFKQNKHEYLSFVTKLPSIFGYDWLIVVVAPLKDFLESLIQTQNQVLLFILFIIILSTLIIIYFAKKISSPIVILAKEINKIKELNLTSKIRVDSNIKEISFLDTAIASMRKVVESFSKYVPKEIVKDFFDTNRTISLGGEKKELSIFFSDVSNFTSIAESIPIDELFPLLDEYFDAMSKIILGLNGTIDKFIGDGIMAFWGAPSDVKDHAQKACDAALICHSMLEGFNAKRRKEGKPEFPSRFGIHSGEVIVGNIGTADRLNYTIIGDAVNTTARLQEEDKVYQTSIIISEEVFLKLGKDYIARPLDIVTVKGRTHKTKIYELVGKIHAREDIRPTSSQIDLCLRFTKAYEAMQANHLEEAKDLFSAIAENYPHDFPTQIYLKRISS